MTLEDAINSVIHISNSTALFSPYVESKFAEQFNGSTLTVDSAADLSSHVSISNVKMLLHICAVLMTYGMSCAGGWLFSNYYFARVRRYVRTCQPENECELVSGQQVYPKIQSTLNLHIHAFSFVHTSRVVSKEACIAQDTRAPCHQCDICKLVARMDSVAHAWSQNYSPHFLV